MRMNERGRLARANVLPMPEEGDDSELSRLRGKGGAVNRVRSSQGEVNPLFFGIELWSHVALAPKWSRQT